MFKTCCPLIRAWRRGQGPVLGSRYPCFFNGVVMYIDCIVTLVSKNQVFNKYMHVFVCLGEIMLSLYIYMILYIYTYVYIYIYTYRYMRTYICRKGPPYIYIYSFIYIFIFYLLIFIYLFVDIYIFIGPQIDIGGILYTNILRIYWGSLCFFLSSSRA